LSAFVLDRRKRPVMPCCEKRARLLVERGRAGVDRRYPLTIRLMDRVGEADGTRFPSHSCMRTKSVRGFQTGDMMRAEVPTGKKAGPTLDVSRFVAAAVSAWAMPTESTPSAANFSIARPFATPGNPRLLPVLKNGVANGGDSDDDSTPMGILD
jgi:hypothetical protein